MNMAVQQALLISASPLRFQRETIALAGAIIVLSTQGMAAASQLVPSFISNFRKALGASAVQRLVMSSTPRDCVCLLGVIALEQVIAAYQNAGLLRFC